MQRTSLCPAGLAPTCPLVSGPFLGIFLPHICRSVNRRLRSKAGGLALPSACWCWSPLSIGVPRVSLGKLYSGTWGATSLPGAQLSAAELIQASAAKLGAICGLLFPAHAHLLMGYPKSQRFGLSPQCTCFSHQVPSTEQSAYHRSRQKNLSGHHCHPHDLLQQCTARHTAVSQCLLKVNE